MPEVMEFLKGILQHAWVLLLAVAGHFNGRITATNQKVSDLRQELSDHKENVAGNYASRAELKESVTKLEEANRTMCSKLEQSIKESHAETTRDIKQLSQMIFTMSGSTHFHQRKEDSDANY